MPRIAEFLEPGNVSTDGKALWILFKLSEGPHGHVKSAFESGAVQSL